MRRTQQCFTLIEVMIVVAVIGILTAIALPSYNEYIRRGHRADARTNLLQVAQWMERAATANGTYPFASNAARPGDATAIANTLSAANNRLSRYDLTMVSDANTFTITAQPRANTAQVGDKCGSLTLSGAGVRGASPLTGGATVEECWRR